MHILQHQVAAIIEFLFHGLHSRFDRFHKIVTRFGVEIIFLIDVVYILLHSCDHLVVLLAHLYFLLVEVVL